VIGYMIYAFKSGPSTYVEHDTNTTLQQPAPAPAPANPVIVTPAQAPAPAAPSAPSDNSSNQ
ncbi:MAG: hypothetical protein ACRD3W_07560, partial [Terriglobales bacterium]